MSPRDRRTLTAGIGVAISILVAVWLDIRFGWYVHVFRAFAHLFYEKFAATEPVAA